MGCSKSSSKFIEIQFYLKKKEKHQRYNLTLHLKQLEEEEENPKISIRKEIIKIWVEINEKGEVTTDSAEIQRITRDCYENSMTIG